MNPKAFAQRPAWQQAIWVLAMIGVLVFLERQFQNYLGKRAIAYAQLPEQSMAAALEQSATDGKPVLANFSALWCAPCRKLAREVLANEQVRNKILGSYHYVRLEYESQADSEWFRRYGVSGFPTVLIIQGDAVRQVQLRDQPGTFLQQL